MNKLNSNISATAPFFSLNQQGELIQGSFIVCPLVLNKTQHLQNIHGQLLLIKMKWFFFIYPHYTKLVLGNPDSNFMKLSCQSHFEKQH